MAVGTSETHPLFRVPLKAKGLAKGKGHTAEGRQRNTLCCQLTNNGLSVGLLKAISSLQHFFSFLLSLPVCVHLCDSLAFSLWVSRNSNKDLELCLRAVLHGTELCIRACSAVQCTLFQRAAQLWAPLHKWALRNAPLLAWKIYDICDIVWSDDFVKKHCVAVSQSDAHAFFFKFPLLLEKIQKSVLHNFTFSHFYIISQLQVCAVLL